MMTAKNVLLICLLIFNAYGGYCAENVRHVIHILVDGLSAIYLKQGMSNYPGFYPNFERLVNEGATTFNARCDYYYSETLPNITTVITARPVSKKPYIPVSGAHGINFNYYIPGVTIHNYGDTNKGYISSIFDVVHDAGMVTGFFGVKEKLLVITDSYNELNGAEDVVGDDNGRNKIDYVEINSVAYLNGAPIVQSFLEKMSEYHFNYVFLHIGELDYYGHNYGWGSDTWFYYLVIVDHYIGLILNLIESDSELAGSTAIVLTADHGGGMPYNTHVYPEYELNYTIPLFVWGGGLRPDSDLYDYFSNRLDPEHSRVRYDDPYQPLRNGDSSNIAAYLLGLNPIPNSWLIPVFGEPPIFIKYEKRNDVVILSWKSSATNYVLESTDWLSEQSIWSTVNPNTILNSGNSFRYNYTLQKNTDCRFFRLRRAQ